MEAFSSYEHSDGMNRHRVVEAGPGDGPPIILMHEMDGYRDVIVDLINRFADAGFNVHAPVFFDLSRLGPTAAAAVGFSRICISREFHVLTTRGNSPAAEWVRSLAAHLGAKGNRKVGVVGMCLTGGLALAAVVDDSVGAAVAAQPAMPFANGPPPIGSDTRRRSLGLSTAEVDAVAASGTPILALRFDCDRRSPKERVVAIDELSNGCAVAVRDGTKKLRGHPTLTATFRDKDVGRARASAAAIDDTISFLWANLGRDSAERP